MREVDTMLLRFHLLRHRLLMLLPAAAFAQDGHVVSSFLPDCLPALLPSGETLIEEARRAHHRSVVQEIGDGQG